MLFLGCDPDMHTMPFVLVDETLQVKYITVAGDHGPLKEQKAILQMAVCLDAISKFDALSNHAGIVAYAVEAQEIYPSGPNKTKNPRNILHLGTVAGIALALCASVSVPSNGYFPLPTQWKGQVNKLAHHMRILKAAGISDYDVMGGKEPYCVPTKLPYQFNRSDWKHIVDAIGLAQYAATCYLDSQRKQKYLTQARTPSTGVTT